MLGDFSYSNPTKLYFGEHALEGLRKELPAYGKNVLLVYGGGSIRKNGIYDRVVEILKACGKEIVEDGGVMPNPTVEKLYEGCRRARDGKVELILAVGGGSVCDYAKARSPSRLIARRIPGRNIISVWRTRTTRSSRWAAC